MTFRWAASIAVAAIAIALGASAARADAIDGNWCQDDGKRMSIQGSNIVTPRGTRTTGNYDRHAYSYTVPTTDPGAGSTINMILIDDDTLHSRADAAPGYGPGEADVWSRCAPTTS